MTRFGRTFWLTASTLAMASAAQAQDDVIDLGTLTLYALQSDFELERTGTTVDVLEAEVVNNALTLGDALDSVPGVSLTSNGGIGASTALRVRGLPERYTPVYYNGIEVADPSGVYTQFDFANALPGAIDRVEVLRGSQSARFGAGAVAGTIAMNSAQAPEGGDSLLSYGLEYGSYNTRRGNLSMGFSTDNAGFALSIASVATDGFSAVDGPLYDDDDGYSGTQLSFDSYVDVTPDLRLGLTGFVLRSSAGYDSPGATIPASGLSETDSRGLRAYAELTTGAIQHSFDISQYRIDRTLTNSGSFFSGPVNTFAGERDAASYKGIWDASEAYTLIYGLDWKREDAAAAPEAVTNRGAFVEAHWSPNDTLDLSFSLRQDNHSAFGDFTSGRATVAWQATPDWTIRAVLSNGFRAPALDELYNPFYGNPNLEPEKSRSAELGAERLFANGGSIRGTLFYTEIDNLIAYFDPDGFLGPIPGGYAQVPGESVTKGLELSGMMPLGDRTQLMGSFTYTDSRDSNGDPQQRVPRYDLSLAVESQLTDRLTGMLSVQHQVDFPDTFGVGFSPVSVDDFTTVDARIGYEFDNGIEAYVRVENLLDADNARIPDYNRAGRSVYFGVNASF